LILRVIRKVLAHELVILDARVTRVRLVHENWVLGVLRDLERLREDRVHVLVVVLNWTTM